VIDLSVHYPLRLARGIYAKATTLKLHMNGTSLIAFNAIDGWCGAINVDVRERIVLY
jgi:hypothetical protein